MSLYVIKKNLKSHVDPNSMFAKYPSLKIKEKEVKSVRIRSLWYQFFDSLRLVFLVFQTQFQLDKWI